MSELPAAYQQLLERGHDLAWAGNWREAAMAYRSAIALRDNDAVAFINLGLALANAGEAREALRAYQRALVLNPDDVTALQKVADLHAQLGERLQASSTYLLLADRLMQARQPAQAVRAWQQVVQYEPTNRLAFRRLADAYQRGRRNDLAAQALTGLARLHADAGEAKEAQTLAEQALALQPDSVPARQLLTLLTATPDKARAPGRRGTTTLRRSTEPPARSGDGLSLDALGVDVPVGEMMPSASTSPTPGSNPVVAAQQRAQERLATAIFEEQPAPGVAASLTRALDFQRRGLLDEAAGAYEAALEEGGERPELRLILGALYQQLFRFGDAIQQFERVEASPDYGMASHFAIGQSCWNQGGMDEAIQHFLQSVEAIDLERVEREQADEAIAVYAGLVEAYDATGDHAQAERYGSRLSDFLANRGWADKLRAWQAYYGEGASGPVEPLDSETSLIVSKALETAEQYRGEGRIRAAIEELYWVLTDAPFYLPLHLMLVELFVADQQSDAAVAKLGMVAETYLIRSNPSQAIRALKRALEIAPVEQLVRGKLIELLMTHGEIDEAIHHYIQLAEGFYELAQIDRAIEKLNEALRLAPRANLENEWQSRIQCRLADIHLQRLDWRRAAAAYEDVHSLTPEDVEVAQRLADLYATKLDAPERAQALIAETVQHLRERGGLAEAMTFVQGQIEERPDDADLFKMLGELQVSADDTEAAAQSWEQAVELLVGEGERPQAAALLRRIIALHTAREQRYRAMLNHLMKM